MDPQWSGAPPSGSITCMLCRGSVPFAKTETQNFRSHLQHHHGVFYHHDVLISVNVLSKIYLGRILQEYERSGEKSELVGEEDSEELIELEETVERVAVNLPRKNDVKKETKVHNCKTCNMKFERLSDLIEHVNEHKAEEKRNQDEAEVKRQALEAERRRILEEKRVIRHQKEMEKRRLEEEKARVQMEMSKKRQAELIGYSSSPREGNTGREIIGQGGDLHMDDSEGIKDSERKREISKMRESLKQFSESESKVTNEEVIPKQTGFSDVNESQRPVIFECQECSYKTKRNIELKLHKLSHTGEKNFACELCDEKFYLDRHLKRHVLKHTSEFDKKFNVQKIVSNDPRQHSALDASLPVKPYVDETVTEGQADHDITPMLPKKQSKRPRTESLQDKILSVLSDDGNSQESRRKSRGSVVGRGVAEVVANSEYFQKFPNQIRRGSTSDERFSQQDPTMPEGWRYREVGPRPNGRKDKEYCSPDSMMFRSRRSMVEYMKYMGKYSQEEIERAEKGY